MKTLMKKLIKKVKGFTLLEILLVVGTIAILAGIVIIAINPSKQLAQVRNTERKSDLKQVANAITQFYIDKGYYPASTTLSTTSLITICPTGASSSPAAGFDCDDMLNLSELVPTYIVAIPNDPATTTISGYSVVLVNNNPAVSAPLAELGVTISVGNVPTVAVDACSHLATDLDCWSTLAPNLYVWGPIGVTGINDTDDGIVNTAALVAIPGDNYPAAEYCDALDEGGHSDWYLPAVNELTAAIDTYTSYYDSDPNWGGFALNTYYWTSTESQNNEEYDWLAEWCAEVAGYNGISSVGYDDKNNDNYANNRVRCLR